MLIREARPEDLGAIIRMTRDFAEYERLQDSFEATVEDLSDVLFGPRRFVSALVADDEGDLVGYAIFYTSYSTFRGQRAKYLEDIYVKPAFQGRGLGEAMLREIARIASAEGCARIDFQVLEWNEPAIRFYKKLGAVSNEDEVHFKFSDQAFVELAK